MEDNSYTLEQMRADYQALKVSLSDQEIVNERLMREVMKGKVGGMKVNMTISLVATISVMIAAPFVFHFNPVVNASWWFIGATELLMGFCVWLDWKFNHKVRKANLATCDLLTFCRDVKRLKADYKGWTKWGLTLGLVWAAWLIVEVVLNSSDRQLAISMITGISVGLLTGFILGRKMNRKIIDTCDQIISNIEE